MVELGRLRGKNDVEEIIGGRMAFHFVILMVLVGLFLEASIAAKREQDYLPTIEWKLSFGGVLVLFTVLNFFYFYFSYGYNYEMK